MEVINNSKLYKDLVFKVLLPLSKSMKVSFVKCSPILCECLDEYEASNSDIYKYL